MQKIYMKRKMEMEMGKHNVHCNEWGKYWHYIDLILLQLHLKILDIRLGCAIQFHTTFLYFGMCTLNSIMTPCHMFMGFNWYSPRVVRVLIMCSTLAILVIWIFFTCKLITVMFPMFGAFTILASQTMGVFSFETFQSLQLTNIVLQMKLLSLRNNRLKLETQEDYQSF